MDKPPALKQLDEFLTLAMQRGASDLHLKVGIMPVIRKHGSLKPLSNTAKPLGFEELESIADALLDQKMKLKFEEDKDIDLGYGVSGLGRFRVSICRQRSSVRIVIRNIPHHVPSYAELNLPEAIKKLADFERGLVLVTGVTGAGKSSTLAAIIDDVNRRKSRHILTIEDPIEFLIKDRKSIVTQRELGVDSTSFARALRASLRQDPDVILIGEMRDKETIETALLAAETGHLVLSTLHTMDATETINRILAQFDGFQQNQIRIQLASVLKAVISQRLARRADGKGFLPAVEIMINNPRVQDMIENSEKTKDIKQVIEESRTSWGMQSFDQSLMDLVTQNFISLDEALALSTTPEDFRIRYGGVTQMDGKKWSDNNTHKVKLSDAWAQISEIEVESATEIKKRAASE